MSRRVHKLDTSSDTKAMSKRQKIIQPPGPGPAPARVPEKKRYWCCSNRLLGTCRETKDPACLYSPNPAAFDSREICEMNCTMPRELYSTIGQFLSTESVPPGFQTLARTKEHAQRWSDEILLESKKVDEIMTLISKNKLNEVIGLIQTGYGYLGRWEILRDLIEMRYGRYAPDTDRNIRKIIEIMTTPDRAKKRAAWINRDNPMFLRLIWKKILSLFEKAHIIDDYIEEEDLHSIIRIEEKDTTEFLNFSYAKSLIPLVDDNTLKLKISDMIESIRPLQFSPGFVYALLPCEPEGYQLDRDLDFSSLTNFEIMTRFFDELLPKNSVWTLLWIIQLWYVLLRNFLDNNIRRVTQKLKLKFSLQDTNEICKFIVERLQLQKNVRYVCKDPETREYLETHFSDNSKLLTKLLADLHC